MCIFVYLHSSVRTLAYCNLGRGCHPSRLRACLSLSRTWVLQRCAWPSPPSFRDACLVGDLFTEAFSTSPSKRATTLTLYHVWLFDFFFFFLCLLTKLSENGHTAMSLAPRSRAWPVKALKCWLRGEAPFVVSTEPSKLLEWWVLCWDCYHITF